MRKRLVAVLAAAVAFAALVSAAASPSRGFAGPEATSGLAKEQLPLLGMHWSRLERRRELVQVDPVSLDARPEPAIGLGSYGGPWAYSPDRERLAVAATKATRRGSVTSLLIVRSRTLRRELALPLGDGSVRALAWLEPDRVVVARLAYHPERLEVVAVAPSAKRVIARSVLRGEVTAVGHARDALVLLLAPQGRIGAGTLVVVSAGGNARSVVLDRVWIGLQRPETPTGEHVATQRRAGLAIDPVRGRALVFPAGSDAAEVDLSTLAVTYRSLAEPVSLFGRLRQFLDPAATAKSIDGPLRTARWLGGGLVAVTGVDFATWTDGQSTRHTRSQPAGLTLVDTYTWRTRTLDPAVTWVDFADGLLVATGAECSSAAGGCSTIGVAAYDLRGRRQFRLFEGEPVQVWQVYEGRAYVLEEGEPLRVVDLARGEVVGTRDELPPWLLLGDVSDES